MTNPDIFLADAVSMRRKANPALAVMTRRNNQRKIMEVCFFRFGLVVNFENCFNQFNVIYCIFNETIWANFQQLIFWANQNQYFQISSKQKSNILDLNAAKNNQRSEWYYSSKLWRAGVEQTLKYFVLKNIKRKWLFYIILRHYGTNFICQGFTQAFQSRFKKWLSFCNYCIYPNVFTCW